MEMVRGFWAEAFSGDERLNHTTIECPMTDEYLSQRLMTPETIPDWPAIERIFWDCLSEAERTFGPRATGWEYTVGLRQSPSYPETINDGQSQVTVWLTAERSWVGYYFEAAHEAVHCLNPIVPSGSAKYIEEAIALDFSLGEVHRIFGQRGLDQCTISPDYLHARSLAYEIDGNIIRLGQRLRAYSGALGQVTARAIEEFYPEAPEQAIMSSLRRFPRQ